MEQQGAGRSGSGGARRRRFLDHLAETGNVSAAARAAGLGRATIYAWRKQDADFAEAWNDAVIEAIDALEAEARRRAVEGIEQPILSGGKFVRHEDGSIATIRQYSDRLLEFLLKALRPERYRPEIRRNPTEEKADGDIAALSDDERAERILGILDAGRTRHSRLAADRPADEAPALDATAGTAEPGL